MIPISERPHGLADPVWECASLPSCRCAAGCTHKLTSRAQSAGWAGRGLMHKRPRYARGALCGCTLPWCPAPPRPRGGAVPHLVVEFQPIRLADGMGERVHCGGAGLLSSFTHVLPVGQAAVRLTGGTV